VTVRATNEIWAEIESSCLVRAQGFLVGIVPDLINESLAPCVGSLHQEARGQVETGFEPEGEIQ